MIEIKRKKQPAETRPERAQKPAEALDAQAMERYAQGAEPPVKGQIRPFTGIDEKRNYRAMYRAAFEYHERHNPPTVDREYWQTHTAGEDDIPQAELDYWARAIDDLLDTGQAYNNRFINSLLAVILDELDREYQAARRRRD